MNIAGFLDEQGIGTITFIAGLILTVIAYISNEINYLEATAAIGFVGIGTYGIGRVRNEAGKGTNSE